MENKERFMSLIKSVERDGMTEFLKWLENTDFFEAPASTKHHLSEIGGLLQHSLNVYDELKRLITVYPNIASSVTEENIIVSTLLHDICKVNFYKKEKRNRKNDAGQWESYDSYAIDEKFCFGGHGSKSVFIVQQFMKLEPCEAIAINCHMSCWDGNKDVSSAYSKNNFAWLVHVADESASFVLEGGK